MSKHKKTESHHLIPRSREDGECGFTDLNNPKNLKELRVKLHRILHQLFVNKAPHEQMEFLIQLNWTVISKESRSKILEIINDKSFYKEKFTK